VFTSVRPESLNEVDADTRDRWVVSAAKATLDRLAVFAKALDSDLRGEELRAALESGGAPAPLAAGIPKAIEHYDTSTAYVEAVRRLAVDALELIAGDRDEVRALDLAPDAGGEAAIGALPTTDVTIEAPTGAEPDAGTEAPADAASETSGDDTGGEAIADAASETADATAQSATEDAVDAESETADPTAESATDAVDAESEATAEVESDANGLGDFDAGDDVDEAGGTVGESLDEGDALDESDDLDAEPASEPDDVDPAGDEMYELNEAEREEIESEFGTDFATGSEVDEPGEADIDVPDPEELQETPEDAAAADLDADPVEAASAEAESGEAETTDDSDDDADVDVEAAAVDAMGALDDGDGADREAVVERVVDEHGVDADAVEDAIQDALMSGKCYEPGDGVLKPI
jgi:hypothetical protein